MNLVDILMAIVIISTVCLARNDGIVAGLFKLFGVFCTMFIALHYYVYVAKFIQNFLGKNFNAEIFSYCFLVLTIFLIFVFTSKGWGLVLDIKPFANVDRWGNLIISLVRSYYVCSLIFLGLLLSGTGYAANEAEKSVSWHLIRKPAVNFYKASHKAIVSNVFPDEKINEKIFKLIEVTPRNIDNK